MLPVLHNCMGKLNQITAVSDHHVYMPGVLLAIATEYKNYTSTLSLAAIKNIWLT